MTREETPAYIVYCPACNNMIGAAVDDGEHPGDVAEFVAEHIRAGFIVERKTVADARSGEWCNCAEPA